MNAEEIRKEANHLDRRMSEVEPLSPQLDVAFWSAQAQLEIAAQLAEANELKRLEVEALNNLGSAVNLLTHEGSPLGKLTGSAESIAVSLDMLMNRGRP